MTDEDRHIAVQELIPWFVTGRLDREESDSVSAHLLDCALCREDVARENVVAASVAADAGASTPDWSALAARLDALPPPVARRRTRDPFPAVRRLAARPRPLRWVIAAQFVALIVLGGQTLNAPRQSAEYRALGDAAAERRGNTLAMFRPDTTEADLRRALQRSSARLVDGPTASGAYILDLPGDGSGAALARLRQDAGVTMAEPIGQAPAR